MEWIGQKASLENQEKLTQLLLRIMTVTAGSEGMSYLIEFATKSQFFF
jgi:hypothetical protein